MTKYVQAAMRRATYKLLEEGEGYFGRIPQLQGVWASAPTLEECREELQETLEDWILFRISEHLDIPPVDGIDLNIRELSKQEEVA